MIKVFLLPFLLFLFCSAGSFQLTKRDVRRTTQVMLNHHVEYKEFSPLLARRSLKIFIEQFDPERIYLTADEAFPFLDPKEKRLKATVSNYLKDDLAEYAALNQVIQTAILRSRKLREVSEQELILQEEESSFPSRVTYVDFAKNEAELKQRITAHLGQLLARERQFSDKRRWDTKQKQKSFELWERRLQRNEETYLHVDEKGKNLSHEASEHFLSMHVMKAIAKSLDAHTSFYTPEEAQEMRASLEKQFEGIGIILREGIEGVMIVGLIKGGPAERSGRIIVGDVIAAIDGSSVRGLAYEEVLRKLQGNGQKQVQLELCRNSTEAQESVTVSLPKEKIVMQEERLIYSYEPFAEGIIGKLTLPSFYESADGASCERDIKEALRALKKEGRLLGLVLDLRENSGGFLSQAVKVSSLFLSSGVVVISKYAQGEIQYLRNLDIHSYYNGPLIVLTSKASASAAEIVAQALQDYGVALVVGDERTYGKGTIQYQTVTDRGAPCFFKVTVGRYYTVSGRSTQIDGVLGDILVPTFYAAVNIGERFLAYPLKGDRMPSAYVDPLTDIDQRQRSWFQQNYIPHLQKKMSEWTQMIPHLKRNVAQRIATDKDFSLFLKAQKEQKARPYSTSAESWGTEDLQMSEAVRILKDMLYLKGKPA